MVTFAVFNHPAPPPSFLSRSHQFHTSAHFSHGDVTRVSQEPSGPSYGMGKKVQALTVLLTPGISLERHVTRAATCD